MLLAVPCWSQRTGKAETSGPCSPAVTGNNNQFSIKCQGINKEQGQKMLDILNKILANQPDPKAVNEKLDEILKLISQRIPADRRLSPDQKVALAACLKTNPGKYSIDAIANNREAYTYAQDWFDVFHDALWTNELPIPIGTIISSGDVPPIQFNLHGTLDQIAKLVSLTVGSPEQNALQCLAKAPISGGGTITPTNDIPPGTVRIFVNDHQNQQ